MAEARTFAVIVGGGITGLTLGHRLRGAGVPHLLLESSNRVGGVIRSARVNGSLLEWGPQRARLTTSFRELIDQLEIAPQLVTAPPRLPLFVQAGGRLRRVPFSALGFLRSDIVPLSAKLRLLAEPFTAAARPDERVADYFIRKLGPRVYANLAGPLYGGLYASDPADMVVRLSLGHVLAEFGVKRSLVLRFLRGGGAVDPPVACSFIEGLETLPRALGSRNGDNIRLNSPVRSLRRSGGDWLVVYEGGEVVARHVVLAAPAPAIADLLRAELPAAAEAIGKLRYNPLGIVHLRAETNLRGLGYQVGFGESLVTRGVTFNDSLFARKDVYTAYLGGSRRPEVVEWPDEDIGKTAAREFAEVTGFPADVLHVDREWMPAWDASWRGLDGLRLPERVHAAANWHSRPGIPGRLGQATRLAKLLAEDYAATATV